MPTGTLVVVHIQGCPVPIQLYDPAVLSTINSEGEATWDFRTWEKDISNPGYCVTTIHSIPIKYIEKMEFKPTKKESRAKEIQGEVNGQSKER